MNKVFVVAEAGINHNGNIEIVKRLIDGAKFAGCDAIKFQKRTVELVYTEEELNKYRESPWGITNRAQKEGIELITQDYDEIDRYCKEIGIEWFASCWDLASQNFMKKYDCKYNKVASARLGHESLIREIAKEGKYTFISTGMSTLEEIEKVVAIFDEYNCEYELMHCNSCYPAKDEDLNLRAILTLKNKFGCNVGYSCHSPGIIPPVVAVALGASSIEKHITLDRTMYGSDQSASVEIMGLKRMIDYIRDVEKQLGNGLKTITVGEEICRTKLWKTKDNE
jgi:N-acetylneuraminate synthase